MLKRQNGNRIDSFCKETLSMGIVPNVSGYGTGGETSPDEPNPVS